MLLRRRSLFNINLYKSYGIINPSMSSYTSPSGQVTYGPDYFNTYYPWYCFQSSSTYPDTNQSFSWAKQSPNYSVDTYIGYIRSIADGLFIVKSFTYLSRAESGTPRCVQTFQLQGTLDGSTWTNIGSVQTCSNGTRVTNTYDYSSNTTPYRGLRMKLLSGYDSAYVGTGRIRWYGYSKTSYSW